MADLWLNFKLAKFDQVMRQKDGTLVIALLNKIRLGNTVQSSADILKTRFVQRDDPKYPFHALHNFNENAPS